MAAEVRLSASTRPEAPAHAFTSAVSRVLDWVTDLAVLGFAGWTVLYHLGLIFDLPTNPLLVVWVMSLVGCGWYLARGRRHGGGRRAAATVQSRLDLRLLASSVVLAVASAALIFFGSSQMWWPGWLVGAAAAAVALVAVLRASKRPGDPAECGVAQPVSLVGTYLAALTALGLGGLSAFIVHWDPDDIFYVNRAAWVAEHGTIPVKDTIFTDQAIPALRGAGVPVSSIEAFQGAVAHVFGLAGGTVAYLATPPIAVFLAVWALWRLIRAWAPRRLPLCFAVAIVYLLWDAGHVYSAGAFFIIRMQQGKAIFVGLLVPVLFLYLTRWVNRPNARTGVLLAAAGASAIGFTSSATFLVPLVCAAVALPLLLLRRYRLALGSMLPFIYPLIVGVVVHFSSAGLDALGVSYTGEQAFRMVVGGTWFGAIGWVGALCAAWLVRRGGARYVAVGVPIVLLILTAPGVYAVMNTFTGAHAVLWRAMWMAPLPALVGVAAAVRLPVRLRWVSPLPALAVAVAIVLAGLPFWSKAVEWTSHPSWRYAPSALAQARRVIDADQAPGTVLAPYPTMQGIAIATTRVHAIDPRDSYRNYVVESAGNREARTVLSRLIFGHVAPQPQVRAALRKLRVGMVCLEPSWHLRRRYVEQSGYTQIGRVGSEVCYEQSNRS